jgi:hypothetical protein
MRWQENVERILTGKKVASLNQLVQHQKKKKKNKISHFCSDENIQTIFGTKLEDFLNYRIDYNSISQTVEKVVDIVFSNASE